MPWNDSYKIWCEVVCDRKDCNNRTAGRYCINRLERVKIRNTARASGWKLSDNEWICVVCIGREELAELVK